MDFRGPAPEKTFMTMFPKSTPTRLKGNAMRVLRFECWRRDGGRCRDCGCEVSFSGKHPTMRPMHMAHVRNKRMFGDLIDNVLTKCSFCHSLEHAGGKPCPAKGVPDANRREA